MSYHIYRIACPFILLTYEICTIFFSFWIHKQNHTENISKTRPFMLCYLFICFTFVFSNTVGTCLTDHNFVGDICMAYRPFYFTITVHKAIKTHIHDYTCKLIVIPVIKWCTVVLNKLCTDNFLRSRVKRIETLYFAYLWS